MRDTRSIATIRGVKRIWAVGAVHGEATRLAALHEALGARLKTGDAVVYLGNYLGYGSNIRETITELLEFRRRFLGRPPLAFPRDIVYLRGSQEEMWQKLLQLQFASDSLAILNWMLQRGVEATLRAYGGDPDQGRRNASGTLALNEWTRKLRETVKSYPGHDTIFGVLKRAAVTANDNLLFVNSGVDPARPLSAQTDAFWWAGGTFRAIDKPYEGFRRIVRGFDPDHKGFEETPLTVTVDGGCGFGGELVTVCLTPRGELLDRIEA